MRRFAILPLTLLAVALIDAAVALTLTWADGRIPALQPLVRYFEYGRSVPGKLERWIERPGEGLFDVGWRSDILARSAERYAAEHPAQGPVVRIYGMSFTNHVVQAAAGLEPDIRIDSHGGPSAPPNFTYALFLDDRANRRPGDVVVLGVLSSSMPAMAAMSNRTWAFEQPAPFTYPVFRPGDEGLMRIEPLVNSAAEELAAWRDPVLGAAWEAQLRAEDAIIGPAAFALPELDASPLLRQVRRAVALGRIERREAAVLEGEAPGAPPLGETLRRMIRDFARTAREDGQLPLVMLIQGRDPRDADVLALARPALAADDVPHLATAELFDPRDPSGFLGDGHYTDAVNTLFGGRFLEILAEAEPRRAAEPSGSSGLERR